MLDVLLHIARNGENLGSWPVDVVAALLRSEVLILTDLYTLEGFEDWNPLSELLPEQPLVPPFPVGSGNEVDVRWGYFCRDGHVIEGPRRMAEINALYEAEYLTDEHILLVVGEEKVTTIGERNAELNTFSSLAKPHAKAISFLHPTIGWALKAGAALADNLTAGDKPDHIDANPFTVAHRLKHSRRHFGAD